MHWRPQLFFPQRYQLLAPSEGAVYYADEGERKRIQTDVVEHVVDAPEHEEYSCGERLGLHGESSTPRYG